MGEAKQEAEAKQEEKKVEKQEEEKKEEKAEEKKEEAKPSPPPPIVLSVALHCVGCAKKIKKSILKCRGVESVEVDMKQNQVTVKGVLDPQVLCSRIQERTTRKAIVLSPLPPAEGDSKPEAVPSQVSGMATVELLVNMHCEACAEQLKRRILKMRGVQTADTDLSTGKVTVTGTMDGEKLVEYISRRTGKLASIIPQPPKEEGKEEAEKKPEEEKPAEEKKEDKKEDEKAPQPEDGAGGNKEGDGKEEKGGGEEQKKEGEGVANDNANVVGQEEEDMMKKMIYWNGSITGEDEMARRMLHYMPVYVIQQPPPPPQFFSDENPNACCIS
ncbi:heavy metal-associated isoprenylated plant protein 9 isoform X1 [Musa acuminata AAA Group]|uniref:heavy metal-associated isoprenylated plant protein 9 isoform X1 n=1 Tax=Musa acuminata AAA Group TaxID=214697 RepID=UPI0031E3FE55